MKFDITGPAAEASGVVTQGKFGIDDMGFILHLLRNKIYSNIIRAIVQEYLCNGRDAQRVKGNPDVPLRVTLPNAFDQSWKCRDFGNSISPEDMKRVFIQYGASTKRADNLQTGGYGLGCKTGFGYGDTFSVNTFRSGVVRNYACIIDESRCGELVLLGEGPTNEPDGTEIVIPVNASDTHRFREETARATEFWDVRPQILGGSVTWNNYEAGAVMKGQDWFVCNGSYHSSRVSLILDGIEYPFNESDLPVGLPFKLDNRSKVFLKFGVGIIPVSANREQIENDSNSRKTVQRRLNSAGAEMLESFKNKIEAATSFAQACCRLQECCNSLDMSIPNDFLWNGKRLYGGTVPSFPGNHVVYTRPDTPNGKLRNYRQHYFPILEDCVYITTTRDFNNITENGAAAIFKAFPNHTKVCMVRWSDPTAVEKFEGLGFREFSEFYTPKSKKAAMSRLMFYKFSNGTFSRSSVAEFEADQNEKLWCRLHKLGRDHYRHAQTPSNDLLIAFDGKCEWKHNFDVSKLLHFLGGDKTLSLYGFADTLPNDRVEEAIEGLTSIEAASKAKMEELSIDAGEVIYACCREFSADFLLLPFVESKMIEGREALSESSPFRKYLENSHNLSQKLELYKKLQLLVPTFKEVDRKAFGSEVTEDRYELLKSYPMLNFVSILGEYSPQRATELAVERLLDYIKLVDSTRQNKVDNNPSNC